MSVRLPTILGKGIADVHQTLNQEVRQSLKKMLSGADVLTFSFSVR